ncbi:right-handed parallel beta-helix repeat-containing protein [Microvirga sp. 2MCAF38]|uniref:right-handed parallel beta-helix repeat-containing protein n=1 Tax=Microvirga sp. 2MCAF38 TaxID=3232989 RepID=UPI003F9A0614
MLEIWLWQFRRRSGRFSLLQKNGLALAVGILIVGPAFAQTAAQSGSPSPPSGFPDATNTGVPAGTKLTPSGALTISTPGAVIDGLDIKGVVTINASNVTLQNSRIAAANWTVIDIRGSGATIQNCEIDGLAAEGVRGISGAGTFLRNNIHNVEDGIYVAGSQTLIQDNYIHDLKSDWSGPHYDGIQIDGNVSNVTIRHNTVINDHDNTSAIMIDNYFGPITNITVDNNYLSGGGYTIYSDGQFTGGAVTGVSFTNNYVGKGRWGSFSINKNTPHMAGNVEGAPSKR